MSPVALVTDIERWRLEALSRRVLLALHAVGVALTGALFMWDVLRGVIPESRVYAPVADPLWLGLLWAGVPTVAGILLGWAMWRRTSWHLPAAALLLAGVWYVTQTALTTAAWVGNPAVLHGPVGVYALILAPKAGVHLFTVVHLGLRGDWL